MTDRVATPPPMGDHELVQPIGAARLGTHAEVVTAVALASVLAMVATPEDPQWESWLAGRWTKTVRRGTGPQLAAAETFSACVVEVGDARAWGFGPTTYPDLPAPLVKMQVAKFERPRDDGDTTDPGVGPMIAVNPAVEMSTGKTAAQAAHGLFAWFLDRTIDEQSAWVAAGHPLWVRTTLSPAEWLEVSAQATSLIHDSGLTEITPGTRTVAVVDRPA